MWKEKDIWCKERDNSLDFSFPAPPGGLDALGPIVTMRRRRLAELQGQSNSRDRLMFQLGAVKKEAGRA